MPQTALAVAEAFAKSGIDPSALGLAWARVTPLVVIVPAFGLRALPGAARAVLGLVFAASVFPAVGVEGASSHAWPVLAGVELARGLPIAIATAIPLWAATMAGGVADALRGSRDSAPVAVVEGTPTPLGTLMAMLASAIFLATGGPARALRCLALHPLAHGTAASSLVAASQDLAAGIGLAVALGGPLLAAAVIVEVSGALIARAASPAQVHALLAPLRAIGTLAVMAAVFERLATVMARGVEQAP